MNSLISANDLSLTHSLVRDIEHIPCHASAATRLPGRQRPILRIAGFGFDTGHRREAVAVKLAQGFTRIGYDGQGAQFMRMRAADVDTDKLDHRDSAMPNTSRWRNPPERVPIRNTRSASAAYFPESGVPVCPLPPIRTGDLLAQARRDQNVSLAYGNAVTESENSRKFFPSLRIMNAAARQDIGPLQRSLSKVDRFVYAAGDRAVAFQLRQNMLAEEVYWIVKGDALNVLRQGDGGRTGINRIGHDTHRFREARTRFVRDGLCGRRIG